MTILESDIQLLKSQVLDDVPEGGGAATGVAVIDGQSNNLFNDISELDRVFGRVSLRKVFIAVRTQNVDGYFGAHTILADEPDDPDVSALMFTTGDYFDTRDAASIRIESYLSIGAEYRGLLFGNHIAGQKVISIVQREGVDLPAIGDTLDLRKAEGLSTQAEQYVRITDISSKVFTFEDTVGQYTRNVLSLSISDPLNLDFPGFAASRYDASVDYANKTKVYSTIVADAARYYGIVPTTLAAGPNDYTVTVKSIFSQVVPSSRTETSIADVRLNQRSIAATPNTTGGTVTLVYSPAVGTYKNFFFGAAVPGSVVIVPGTGPQITDDGAGNAIQSGSTVGTIDYANGIASIVAPQPSYGAAVIVTYKPAAGASVITQSIGIKVTENSQRLNYIVTIDPPPVKGSTQISYLAQGRWYVLQDDGTGAVRGADTAFGAGNVNFDTGTIAVTLGALPDVGGEIIIGYVSTKIAQPVGAANLDSNQSRFYKVMQLTGAIKPNSITLNWSFQGSNYTATDDGKGQLQGDAKGVVYYQAGRINFSPNYLVPPQTAVTVTTFSAIPTQRDIASFTDGGGNWQGSVGTQIKASTFEMSVPANIPVRQFPNYDAVQTNYVRVFDDGNGALFVSHITGNLMVGTINYTTGAFTLVKSANGYMSTQTLWANKAPWGTSSSSVNNPEYWQNVGQETRSTPIAFLGVPVNLSNPTWAWWTDGNQVVVAKIRVAGGDLGSAPASQVIPVDTLTAVFNNGNATLIEYGHSGLIYIIASFIMGNRTFSQSGAAGHIMMDVNPINGEGADVGTTSGSTVTLTNWNSGGGATPIVTQLDGTKTPTLTGANTVFATDAIVFRTASAPVAPGGFSLQGKFLDDSSFNVTSDTDTGVISYEGPTITIPPAGVGPGYSTTGTSYKNGVHGTINYQTGVVELRFGYKVLAAGDGITDVTYLGITGLTYMASGQAQADTLRYNAVSYTYLPLDPAILGLNPVRLPSDGKVPIFRAGSVVVVHHTATTGPLNVSNGQTINLNRTRLSRVKVVGSNGIGIVGGYAVDLNNGTITFTNTAGYSLPVTIENRIEDAALVADAQISGLLRLTRPLTHTYPFPGSKVSSALLIGDMKARVSLLFDQGAGANDVFSDNLVGSAAPGTFDEINHPPIVTNDGTVTERWKLVFTGSTAYSIIGEHLGQIGVGTTATDAAPLNPATGTAYFTLPHGGFGNGWAPGNIIRLNTVGAIAPIWLARIVQQGEPTEQNDKFSVLVRGDVDTP